MLTGEIPSQIEKLRKNLWEGGVANSLTNFEQITHLLFVKQLDEIQTREEAKSRGPSKNIACAEGVHRSVPYSHYNETKTLTYFMQPVCLLNADGGRSPRTARPIKRI